MVGTRWFKLIQSNLSAHFEPLSATPQTMLSYRNLLKRPRSNATEVWRQTGNDAVVLRNDLSYPLQSQRCVVPIVFCRHGPQVYASFLVDTHCQPCTSWTDHKPPAQHRPWSALPAHGDKPSRIGNCEVRLPRVASFRWTEQRAQLLYGCHRHFWAQAGWSDAFVAEAVKLQGLSLSTKNLLMKSLVT